MPAVAKALPRVGGGSYSGGMASGVIGGMIAAVLLAYFSRRAAFAGAPGQLRFGWAMRGLGALCALATLGLAYIMSFTDHRGQYVSLSILIAICALFTVYTLGETYGTKGTFDSAGIAFRSPWAGLRTQQWSDLVGVRLRPSMSWWVLTFRDGSKIRLSTWLEGHGAVLEHIRTVRADLS